MTDSSPVHTNQTGIHERLAEVVEKHRQYPFQKPIANHTAAVFRQLQAIRANRPDTIILDSGCGTGMSSHVLAEQHPEAWVIGVDRSIDRLSRNIHASDRVSLIQADCVDLWRLLADSAWPIHQHTIFYPNPYPKASQLNQRWHGHAVFPTLVALGEQLEVRSNWGIYIQEFAAALAQYNITAEVTEGLEPEQPVSLFEKKYRQSGHTLWRLRATL